MLAQFRAFSKSPVAVVLLGLLVVAFLFFGITDVFRNHVASDTVIQAGGRTINSAEFKQMFDSYRQELQQQNNGQPITAEMAVANDVDKRLADQLAFSESLGALINRMGIVPSDKLVVEELRKSPAFFDQVSGRFDKQAYAAKLRESGLTEAQFERLLRDQVAQNQLITGIAAGLMTPRAYAATISLFNNEARSFDWFAVDPKMVGAPTPPTDAQLTAFIQQNAPRFTKPEMRQLTVLHFSAAAVAPGLTLNQADVQKRFNFEKDTLSAPEKRTVIQIPVKDAAGAAQVAMRLRANEDPSAIARSVGAQPVIYTDAPKSAVSDRKIADAAFAMKAGDVSAMVQGALGPAVIKVASVTPAHTVTLDEVRPKIEAEVRKDAATEKVYESVQKYEDAHSGGASLAEAAKKVGLPPIALPAPITVQGSDLQGRPSGLPPKVLQAAFMTAQGSETDVVDAGQGEYYAVRVDRVAPPAVASLDEARAAATQIYMVDAITKRAQAKADELAGRIRKGEPIQQVAASVGGKLNMVDSVHRDGSGQMLPKELLGRIFTAKAGDTVVAQGDQVGFIIAKLDRISAGAPTQAAQTVEVLRLGLRNPIFSDLGQAARNNARAVIKPKVDANRARSATGVQDTGTAAGGTGSAGAGAGK